LLPLIVGERMAHEMLLFGRSYTAGQALEVGLVNAVVPDAELEDEARRWAGELAICSASSLRLVKLGLNGMGDMLRVAGSGGADRPGARDAGYDEGPPGLRPDREPHPHHLRARRQR
jgi:enoyl-CoA hydratase/carnithine racemase